jgi:hypothetical protein
MKEVVRLAGMFIIVALGSGCSGPQMRSDTPPLAPVARAESIPEPSNEIERTFRDRLDSDIDLVLADNRHFYSPLNLGLLALGVGGAAPLANGSADQDIRDWYQHRIKQKGLEPLSQAASVGGQVWVIAPLSLELMALTGRFGEDWQQDGGWLEWSNRSLRAVAVGYPPVLALYGILGASRPDRHDSSWHPFEDFHGVSGHTFIGAVPWLTAAEMTDSIWLKAPLVAGSFLTGWSRLHDDKHYFSQIALGWWIAVLSTWSVDQTQQERAWTVTPFVGSEGTGVALQVRY